MKSVPSQKQKSHQFVDPLRSSWGKQKNKKSAWEKGDEAGRREVKRGEGGGEKGDEAGRREMKRGEGR